MWCDEANWPELDANTLREFWLVLCELWIVYVSVLSLISVFSEWKGGTAVFTSERTAIISVSDALCVSVPQLLFVHDAVNVLK